MAKMPMGKVGGVVKSATYSGTTDAYGVILIPGTETLNRIILSMSNAQGVQPLFVKRVSDGAYKVSFITASNTKESGTNYYGTYFYANLAVSGTYYYIDTNIVD